MKKVNAWPPVDVNRFRRLGYWTEETLGEFLRERSRRFADNVAVRDERCTLTYAELDRAADAAARNLRGAGVGPGDRVIIHLDNRVELYILQFGLFRIGAIPVFALPSHGPLELEQLCDHTEAVMILSSHSPEHSSEVRAQQLARLSSSTLRARILFTDDESGRRAALAQGLHLGSGIADPVSDESQQFAPEPDVPHSEDLAFLQLSGGSTGMPKLIPRTHADYLYSVRESASILELTPDDVMYIVLPAAHNFPYSSPGALGVWHAGGTVVLGTSPDPDWCLAQLIEHGVTIVPLVPAIAHVWLMAQENAPRPFPRLRTLQVGGAKLSQDVARSLERAFGTCIQQVFGMAEGLVNYTRLDDDEQTRTATQGLRISKHDLLRIVDDDDNDVPTGTAGHLLTQGPYTMRGYYRNPAANALAFTDDGWYRTGDIVSLDERGYVTVVGRAKSVVNRGGEKVSPEEIEFHLHANPRILDAVVVGIPDRALGERTRATIVTRSAGQLTAADVRAWLSSRGLARFKLPDQVRFADELQRTGVGKNRR